MRSPVSQRARCSVCGLQSALAACVVPGGALRVPCADDKGGDHDWFEHAVSSRFALVAAVLSLWTSVAVAASATAGGLVLTTQPSALLSIDQNQATVGGGYSNFAGQIYVVVPGGSTAAPGQPDIHARQSPA